MTCEELCDAIKDDSFNIISNSEKAHGIAVEIIDEEHTIVVHTLEDITEEEKISIASRLLKYKVPILFEVYEIPDAQSS